MSENYREKTKEGTLTLKKKRGFTKYKPKMSMFKNVLATNYSMHKEKIDKSELCMLDNWKQSNDSEIVEHDQEDEFNEIHNSNTVTIPLVSEKLETTLKEESYNDYDSKYKKSLLNTDTKRRSIAASPFYTKSHPNPSLRKRKERRHTYSTSNRKVWKNATQKLKVVGHKRNFTRPSTRACRAAAASDKNKAQQWTMNKTEINDKESGTEKSKLVNFESQIASVDIGSQVLGRDFINTSEIMTRYKPKNRTSKTGYGMRKALIDAKKIALNKSEREQNRSYVD